MKPQRVKLSRKRGWRKPPNTVVVSRPTRWGNMYKVRYFVKATDAERSAMVENFEAHLLSGELVYSTEDVKRELRGKNLACWCPLDKPCHADVLLRIANEDGAQ